jgi:hypothetical protein
MNNIYDIGKKLIKKQGTNVFTLLVFILLMIINTGALSLLSESIAKGSFKPSSIIFPLLCMVVIIFIYKRGTKSKEFRDVSYTLPVSFNGVVLAGLTYTNVEGKDCSVVLSDDAITYTKLIDTTSTTIKYADIEEVGDLGLMNMPGCLIKVRGENTAPIGIFHVTADEFMTQVNLMKSGLKGGSGVIQQAQIISKLESGICATKYILSKHGIAYTGVTGYSEATFYAIARGYVYIWPPIVLVVGFLASKVSSGFAFLEPASFMALMLGKPLYDRLSAKKVA